MPLHVVDIHWKIFCKMDESKLAKWRDIIEIDGMMTL